MRAHVDDHELVLSLAGELPLRRQIRAAKHLHVCAACELRAQQFQSTLDALEESQLPDHDVSERSADSARLRLEDALRHAAASAPPSWWGWRAGTFEWGSLRAAGAALVACALIGVGLIAVRALPPRSAADGTWSALPNASLTPGAVSPLTAVELCNGVRPSRLVTDAVRRQVLHAYGVEDVSPPAYELDALVTPELGGSTDAANLWPQRYRSPVWNARVKDELERLLPELVCSGRITLAQAQQEIASDWIGAYKRRFNTDVPRGARTALDDDAELIFVGPQPAPTTIASLRLVSR
jgi:hypothetical protein